MQHLLFLSVLLSQASLSLNGSQSGCLMNSQNLSVSTTPPAQCWGYRHLQPCLFFFFKSRYLRFKLGQACTESIQSPQLHIEFSGCVSHTSPQRVNIHGNFEKGLICYSFPSQLWLLPLNSHNLPFSPKTYPTGPCLPLYILVSFDSNLSLQSSGDGRILLQISVLGNGSATQIKAILCRQKTGKNLKLLNINQVICSHKSFMQSKHSENMCGPVCLHVHVGLSSQALLLIFSYFFYYLFTIIMISIISFWILQNKLQDQGVF